MMHQIAYWFLSLSRKQKAFLLIGADVVFAELALWAAFSIRLGVFYVPSGVVRYFFYFAPLLAIPVFIQFGLYRAIIRYIGERALWTIFQAISLYALFFAFGVYLAGVQEVPRTVSFLNWLIMLLLVGGSRFFARWWLSGLYFRISGISGEADCRKKNVVIYGAGSAGVQLASALLHGREFRPVAFIDDDRMLQKQKVNGLRIYPLSSLTALIDRYHLTDLLLAIPSVSRTRRNEIIHLLEAFPIHVRTMPGMADMAQGKVTFDDLQEVDVADLLGRDPVAPNMKLLKANITEKVVLVSGAGGSIGSELCRKIIQLKPAALILYELSEFALYAIEKELNLILSKSTKEVKIVPVLGSVLNKKRLEKICQTFAVNTIYHAAAYKHVPMVEKNPGEAVWNNIFGTLRIARAAIAARVETFVLVSTDKAVRPTNTMGATKRFAELVLQALSMELGTTHQTRFVIVRFGNVLGSSGSVVPLFREQIARGGPVTVTDPRIIRYFMTIPEAAQLVIQAGAMGQGGDVFVLEMGAPIKIVDLAKRMIHLSGLQIKSDEQPNGDIEIVFTGLRSGEKLFEELLIGDNVVETCHPSIMRAEEEEIPWAELEQLLLALERATIDDDIGQVRLVLRAAVSGFLPQCEIEDWLWNEKLKLSSQDCIAQL